MFTLYQQRAHIHLQKLILCAFANKSGNITLECKLHLLVDFGVIFSLYMNSGQVYGGDDIFYLCGWAECRSRWPDDEPCLSRAGRPADAHKTTHSDPWRAKGENKTSSYTAQHFPKLITTSTLRLWILQSQPTARKAFSAEILVCNTEMRLGSICIIYAFVL